jgi:hypothetical protein
MTPARLDRLAAKRDYTSGLDGVDKCGSNAVVLSDNRLIPNIDLKLRQVSKIPGTSKLAPEYLL